jgi:hypothetical protein
MDQTNLVFPQGNDIVVTARYPEISDGTGQTASFYYKPSRYTDDSDPSVVAYESAVTPDPDTPGQTLSVFHVPGEQNEVPGTYWWRIDVSDSLNNTRTANCGPVLVEAV